MAVHPRPPATARPARGRDPRRRPGGQRPGAPPPGHVQPAEHRRLPRAGGDQSPPRLPLHRPERRLHHPGTRPPGRPRLAARPRPVVEPLRGRRLPAGRRDAERCLLPPDAAPGVPRRPAVPADGPRTGHRLVDLRPGPSAGGRTHLRHRRRGGLRAVRYLRLAGPRAHPAGGGPAAVAARGGTGPGGGIRGAAGRMAPPGGGDRALDPGRLPRDVGHRRGLRRPVGRAPDGRPRSQVLVADGAQGGGGRRRRGGAGGAAPRGLRHLRPVRQPRVAQRERAGLCRPLPRRPGPEPPAVQPRPDLRAARHPGPRGRDQPAVGERRGLPRRDPRRRRTGRPGGPAEPLAPGRARGLDRRVPAPHLRVLTGAAPHGPGPRAPVDRLLPVRQPDLGAGAGGAGRPRPRRRRPEPHPPVGGAGRGRRRRGGRLLGHRHRLAAADGGRAGEPGPRAAAPRLRGGQSGGRGGGPGPPGRRWRLGRSPARPPACRAPPTARPGTGGGRGGGGGRGPPVVHLPVGTTTEPPGHGLGDVAPGPPGHLPLLLARPHPAQLRVVLRDRPARHQRPPPAEELRHGDRLAARSQRPVGELHGDRHPLAHGAHAGPGAHRAPVELRAGRGPLRHRARRRHRHPGAPLPGHR